MRGNYGIAKKIKVKVKDHSLTFSTSLSISWIKKRTGPQFLLQIGGDLGPIKTVNIAVCDDVAEILVAAVGRANRFDANWYLVFVFMPP